MALKVQYNLTWLCAVRHHTKNNLKPFAGVGEKEERYKEKKKMRSGYKGLWMRLKTWMKKWQKEPVFTAKLRVCCLHRGTGMPGSCTRKVNKCEKSQKGMMTLLATSPWLSHSCRNHSRFHKGSQKSIWILFEGLRRLHWGNENSWIDGVEGYFQSHLQCHICKQRKHTRKEILP